MFTAIPDCTDVLHSSTVSDVGEHALIERITSRLSMPSWVIVGPGDDAAVVAHERGTLDVLTTDAQVEGIHFDRRFVPAAAIGHRALAVNLSDLAAMGAQPRAALLSLALPGSLAVAAVDEMLDGLLALAAQHGVTLVGGNISRSPGPIMVDVTVTGSVRPRRVLTRSGARPGDEVYVTGTLGEAAIALRSLQEAAAQDAPSETAAQDAPSEAAAQDVPSEAAPTEAAAGVVGARYLRPQPRVRAGMLLGRNRAASSCMDLSDGLADGVRQIAAASGVGMTIEAASLPLGAAVAHWHERHGGDPIQTALAGGEDYELLFTVRPAHRGRLRGVRRQLGDLPISRIGVVTRERTLLLRDPHGLRELPAGFEHFRGG